jgi:hypothetical protein
VLLGLLLRLSGQGLLSWLLGLFTKKSGLLFGFSVTRVIGYWGYSGFLG